MKQIYIYILTAVLAVNTINLWSSVTIEGTALNFSDNNPKVNSYGYVVMRSTTEETATYRVLEVQTRTDAVSRSNTMPAYSIYIDLKRGSGIVWVDQKITIQASENNSTWKDVATVKVNASYSFYGPYTNNITRNTKYIRIKDAGGTKTKYHKEVYHE